MEGVRLFLESSSIHGLSYISSTRKYLRLFWILIVTIGFGCAANLIFASFKSWAISPVSTTIETLPLSEMMLPKVTVCPPKNTFTDLNYDLMLAENKTFTKENRDELIKYAVNVINNHAFLDIFDKLQEENKYYNWYHGLSEIKFPSRKGHEGVVNLIHTSALSGLVKTKYYGEEFNPQNVEMKGKFQVKIYPPVSVGYDKNVTLHVMLTKVSIPSDLLNDGYETSFGVIDRYQANVYQNYTPPGTLRYVKHSRGIITNKIIENIKMQMMPGFQLRWYYTGNIQHYAKYLYFKKTKEFRRRVSK